MPGTASRNLDDLHPAFRADVDLVLESLRTQGFEPVVRETWRDLDRQEYYRDQGWSTVSFGFHNAIDPEGEPDGLAVDLGHAGLDARRVGDHDALGAFYQALRRVALAHGLTTGGTWSRRDARWAAYDLGWDPGHVQPVKLSLAEVRRGQRP